MYNGIGLDTARGSGTNGYVQRNLSFIRRHKDKVDYKSEEELKKLDAQVTKGPNKDILDHERKRKVELKCMEMQELMEEQGYDDDEIQRKVSTFRQMLMEKVQETNTGGVEKDESGRPVAKATHQIAEANQARNDQLKAAFGLSEFYKDGSSMDPQRKTKEEAAKALALAQKKYAILPDDEEPVEEDQQNQSTARNIDQRKQNQSEHERHGKKRNKHRLEQSPSPDRKNNRKDSSEEEDAEVEPQPQQQQHHHHHSSSNNDKQREPKHHSEVEEELEKTKKSKKKKHRHESASAASPERIRKHHRSPDRSSPERGKKSHKHELLRREKERKQRSDRSRSASVSRKKKRASRSSSTEIGRGKPTTTKCSPDISRKRKSSKKSHK